MPVIIDDNPELPTQFRASVLSRTVTTRVLTRKPRIKLGAFAYRERLIIIFYKRATSLALAWYSLGYDRDGWTLYLQIHILGSVEPRIVWAKTTNDYAELEYISALKAADILISAL